MRHSLPAWSTLVLLAPLAIACAVHADVAPPPVTATVQVDANGQAVAPDPNATVSATAPQDGYDDTDPSALTDFHSTLDPHGTWVDDPTYGTVWVPNAAEVGPGFVPYTSAGHWVYDDDYTWVSDNDWGWAPYHYGRWVEIDGRGWSWIPGRQYRGAWVTWGADDGYSTVGWAPMPPEYVWRGGVAVGYTFGGAPRWSYVGRGDVFSPGLGGRVYTGSAAAGAASHVHPTGGDIHSSGGPAPGKLGLSGTQVPHSSGASSVMKAKTFSLPQTATQLGGHPPTKAPPGGLVDHTPSTTPTTSPIGGGHGPTERGEPPTRTGAGTAPTATGTGRTLTEKGEAPHLENTGGAATASTGTNKNPPRKKPTDTGPAPAPSGKGGAPPSKNGGHGGHTQPAKQ